MTRNKICILPKLNDCGGNPKGKWFVYYSYRNPVNITRQNSNPGIWQHKLIEL